MPLTNYYVNAGEGAVATYDYFDFAARTGYKKFYLAKASDSQSSYAIITSQGIDSNPLYTNGTQTSASWHTALDMDFDLDFNAPAILQGSAYLNLTWEAADTANTNSLQAYSLVNLYLVSGGTETLIDTASGAIVAVDGGTGVWDGESKRELFNLDVPNTKVKIGDSIRVNVQIQAKCANTEGLDSTLTRVWADPSNREVTTYEDQFGFTNSTDSSITLPFKIDL